MYRQSIMLLLMKKREQIVSRGYFVILYTENYYMMLVLLSSCNCFLSDISNLQKMKATDVVFVPNMNQDNVYQKKNGILIKCSSVRLFHTIKHVRRDAYLKELFSLYYCSFNSQCPC